MKTHRGIRTLVVVSVVLMVLGSLCIGVGIAKGGDLRYLHVDNGSCHVMQRKEIDRVTTTFSYTAVWGISICSLKDE